VMVGLKILGPARGVRVRSPPPAFFPKKTDDFTVWRSVRTTVLLHCFSRATLRRCRKSLRKRASTRNTPRLSIDKRTNSRFYQARTFVDGKTVLKSTKTTALPTAFMLAEDWYKRLLRGSVAFGRQHPLDKLNSNPTFAEAFGSYRSTLRTDDKRAYADMKWGPISKFWRTILVQDVTTETFREFFASRRKRDKVKNNTLHKDTMVCRQVLNYCIEKEWIEKLPRIPEIGKIEPNPRPWLTPTEWKHLRLVSERRIKQADNVRTRRQRQDLHDEMIFMVHSMCRVDEVRALRFSDCRLEKNANGDKILLCEVTGKRGTRTVVALAGAASVYERRLKAAKQITEKVFQEHHREAFKELLADAGLRKDAHGFLRTMKSLRATAISFRILNNPELNLTLIARNAGCSTSMIDLFYAKRLTAEMNKEALSVMPRTKKKAV
jgi:hypothetical protein